MPVSNYISIFKDSLKNFTEEKVVVTFIANKDIRFLMSYFSYVILENPFSFFIALKVGYHTTISPKV